MLRRVEGATMMLRGHNLYEEMWQDWRQQPPCQWHLSKPPLSHLAPSEQLLGESRCVS